jgi:peptidoglycan/xylan/chitin deacetylase (PgdA/CDA1 family)
MNSRRFDISERLILFLLVLLTACRQGVSSPERMPVDSPAVDTAVVSDPAIKKEVPVLCYHQIKSLPPGKGDGYSVAPKDFEAHMKMLHDSGYQSILPNQLYQYYVNSAALPAKPVMITFDDNTIGQYTIAAPAMERYGFRGVFFVMTVALNKPGYMSAQQIQDLHARGHTIGCHTWDHHDVRTYTPADWITQLHKPTRQLENITAAPVQYFAYPFGAWNSNAIDTLRARGYKLAFILNTKGSSENPLLSVRRISIGSHNAASTVLKNMHRQFRSN